MEFCDFQDDESVGYVSVGLDSSDLEHLLYLENLDLLDRKPDSPGMANFVCSAKTASDSVALTSCSAGSDIKAPRENVRPLKMTWYELIAFLQKKVWKVLLSGMLLNFWGIFWGSCPKSDPASAKMQGGSRQTLGKLQNYGKPLVKPGSGELKHSSRETLINTVVY